MSTVAVSARPGVVSRGTLFDAGTRDPSKCVAPCHCCCWCWDRLATLSDPRPLESGYYYALANVHALVIDPIRFVPTTIEVFQIYLRYQSDASKLDNEMGVNIT
ncbi:hypothetical protein GWI33_014688 [Rhynchophorus ferrugineus]|uniref:Uncharacterized protein n=1 Tax=Rhynchophorus ferrugineus TaxID=354439 RepID=A0A834I6L1_RHYFE|nr:hypothetical protein GWI33_014688 [Rhynchophorus ferrugineus]